LSPSAEFLERSTKFVAREKEVRNRARAETMERLAEELLLGSSRTWPRRNRRLPSWKIVAPTDKAFYKLAAVTERFAPTPAEGEKQRRIARLLIGGEPT
jgi:hypothetical protein